MLNPFTDIQKEIEAQYGHVFNQFYADPVFNPQTNKVDELKITGVVMHDGSIKALNQNYINN